MPDCIFCKIANGEIPSDLLYEDDEVVAFRDLSPAAPAHVLVVPRRHYVDIADGVPGSTVEAMVRAANSIVEREKIRASGFRYVMNAGADAGQAVNHLHMHVLGGARLIDDFGEKR